MDETLDILLRWEKYGRWLRTLVIAGVIFYGGYKYGFYVMQERALTYIATLPKNDKEASSYEVHPETRDQPGHYPYLEM